MEHMTSFLPIFFKVVQIISKNNKRNICIIHLALGQVAIMQATLYKFLLGIWR